jgi:predicted flap endonuclease-1-like 5' DNA nuclease
VSDIGPVFNQKLHEAGINSFRDFVILTPAEVAAKTGIPVERIERGKWLEQVQKLITDNGK